MKNIETILKELGVELTDEQKTTLNSQVAENYKTVADYDKQKDKLTTAEDKVKTLTESLDKFKDVNVDDLNATIETLKTDMANKDAEYQNKIADRDFHDILKNSITSAKGKDADKIARLLNVDELKASKNQKEDIEKAIKALQEDDVTKGMFGETEPEVLGQGNIIGQVNTNKGDNVSAQMRAVMGLPPTQSE